jgi:hypothetical protein
MKQVSRYRPIQFLIRNRKLFPLFHPGSLCPRQVLAPRKPRFFRPKMELPTFQ